MAVEELLAQPGEDGERGPLATRGSWEYHVCVLPYNGEHKDTVMIAARISTFSRLVTLYGKNLNEGTGRNTRILICKATLRKPAFIHGYDIIIFAVHGNHDTMKRPNSAGYLEIYDTMKWAYGKYGPFFLLGDLNMGMLLVPHELSCRELTSDVLAYYPYTFTDPNSSEEKLGLDSCCILYVGGDEVESRLSFSSSQIPKLLSASRGDGTVTSDWGVELHSYRNAKEAPGQPWWDYKSKTTSNLETMLKEFLVCRKSQEQWKLEKASKKQPVTHLRFRQKQMPQDSVFVNGEFHKGAHMNLMVWTHFPKPTRSKEFLAKKKEKRNEKYGISCSDHQWSGDQWSGHQWSGQSWSGHQWSDQKWKKKTW